MWQLLIPVVGNLLDKLIPDKEAAAAAKLKLFEMQSTNQLEELKGAVSLILAEMSGNWLQRSWRPILMLTFGGLIVARWLGFAAPNLSPDEYIKLWDIVQLGIGGYVVGRSAEKIADTVAVALKKGN